VREHLPRPRPSTCSRQENDGAKEPIHAGRGEQPPMAGSAVLAQRLGRQMFTPWASVAEAANVPRSGGVESHDGGVGPRRVEAV
jgi:hypothetical protein